MIHALHGAVGMAKDWKEILPEAHAWDLWGMLSTGERPLAEAGEIIARAASDGDTLVGYSMGGRIALHALLSGQCRWQEAVIISAHPGMTSGREERLQSDQDWADFAEEDWVNFLRDWNDQAVLSGPEPTWPSRDRLVARRMEVARSFRCWSLGAQDDLRPFLPRISCPVRWIVGEKDEKFVKLAEEAVSLIPDAVLEVVPNAGHRVAWEPGFDLADLRV
ncbi:MAG: alpha/beta fold hydrolase [Akkermansiaceae bacterium]